MGAVKRTVRSGHAASTRPRAAGRRGRGGRLLIPSFAKINLGLEVLGVREDGYHELRTLFQTIAIRDEIELQLLPEGPITVECAHPLVPRDHSNLAVRAARELMARAGEARGLRIGITKRIPVGGGLGGGSSNAAAVLIGLDRLLGLRLGVAGLHPLARRIGADVPFFLYGGTALGVARGDEIYPLADRVRGHVVVVDAGFPVSTAAVFRRIDSGLTPRENSNSIFPFVAALFDGVRAYSALRNELEWAAMEESPALAARAGLIRRVLEGEGALLAAMTGSGASFFGLFSDVRRATRASVALQRAGLGGMRSQTLDRDRYRRYLS